MIYSYGFRFKGFVSAFLLIAGLSSCAFAQNTAGQKIAIVIDGGAGTIRKSNLTPSMEQEYRTALAQALNTGYEILRKGGSAIDAVEAAIMFMEDSPLFNAGKGAVFTHDGTNELDASVMVGNTLKAGAVTGVKHIKNPIALARRVMERSKHVMFSGAGAEAFAKSIGIDTVPAEYFYTQRRWDELQRAKKAEGQADTTHGTVGCVALDRNGTIAAGTSTGGITNKMAGRIGDSPIIGAGTYADDKSCGVSATGDGEYFIRATVARSVGALMEYGHLPLQQAADSAIAMVGTLGGTGGLIALDRSGHIVMSFNTEGMYRAYIDDEGKAAVKIYKDN